MTRLSIFDGTDGVFFNGWPGSLEWLSNRGYYAFRYGDPDSGPVGKSNSLFRAYRYAPDFPGLSDLVVD